jgi:hypothetical protein
MPPISLHRSQHYAADWIDGPHGGLCVTRQRSRGGAIAPDPDGTWRAAFADPDADNAERDALCRAFLAE